MRLFRLFTIIRFSFSPRHPGRWRSKTAYAMTMGRTGNESRGAGTPSGVHHAGDLLDLEGLDDVADLDVLVPVEPDAALESLLDLRDVVLEAPQRTHLAFVDDAVVAQQAQLRRTRDDALGHVAAGHDAELRDLEGIAYLRAAARHFLQRRLEQALHGLLDLVGDVVDHGVEADLHTRLLGFLGRFLLGPDVE